MKLYDFTEETILWTSIKESHAIATWGNQREYFRIVVLVNKSRALLSIEH